jgi:hypothetical protein
MEANNYSLFCSQISVKVFRLFTFGRMQWSFNEFVACHVDSHCGSSRHEPFKPRAQRFDTSSSWCFGFKAPLMTEDADGCVQLST